MARKQKDDHDEMPVEQVVRSGEVYTLREGLRRLGWGRDAFDSARSQGLKVIKKLGRAYLSGKHVIEFLEGTA